MTVQGAQIGVGCGQQNGCLDKFGCPPNACPDFTIRRHDTKPSFKVQVDDCDGPLDLENLVLEVNMWAKAKLKKSVAVDDTHFRLADDIGFEQVMVGDIIIMDRIRLPEHMLVTGFDENNKLVQVERGYNATVPSTWKKGDSLRVFRVLNAPAETELLYDDIQQVDGTTLEDQLVTSYLIYEWDANDTCLPGCYWLEFKLIKMLESEASVSLLSTVPSVIPSFTSPSYTSEDFGCKLGDGVSWARRFPVEGEGFLIRIIDSPTTEL